jgi:hypothetical protein
MLEDFTVIRVTPGPMPSTMASSIDCRLGDLLEVSAQHVGSAPVAMTSALFEMIRGAVENRKHCNDWKGVWHDVLWMSTGARRALAQRGSTARPIRPGSWSSSPELAAVVTMSCRWGCRSTNRAAPAGRTCSMGRTEHGIHDHRSDPGHGARARAP